MKTFQIVVLALFYIAFIGRTLYLHLGGIRVFVLGAGKKGLHRLLELFFLFGLLLWSWELSAACIGAIPSLMPRRIMVPLFESPWLQGTGTLIIAAGLAVFFWALYCFGGSWRVGIDHDNPGALVTRGIFSFTRNPIFLFIDLYFTGTFFLNPAIFFLASAGIVLIGIHYQILQEERFLISRYGVSYDRYRSRTPRYFGRSGRSAQATAGKGNSE